LKKSAFTIVLAAFTLVACGGGSDAPDPTTQDTTQSNTTKGNTARNGKVDANYVMGHLPSYFAFQVGSLSTGKASQIEIEEASGAAIRIDDMTLSGDATDIQDIAGNANWTIGRWRAGTVTSVDHNGESKVTTLGGSNNSLHYFIGNTLTALPESGAYNCGGFQATSPTLIWGGGKDTVARENLSNTAATLTVAEEGVVVATSFSITDGSATGSPSYQTTISDPGTSSVRGRFLAGGDGAMFRLYDAGDGKVQITQGYKATLSNNAGYQGIATWTCTPA
jgi:hypothetical protein